MYSNMHVQWNLPYPNLYYPGTSIVWTAQIDHVTCSLLTIMKFGLDKSTRKGSLKRVGINSGLRDSKDLWGSYIFVEFLGNLHTYFLSLYY